MASFWDNLFGGGAEREAAEKNRALYDSYQQSGTGYLNNAYNTSTGYLNSALGAYAPLSSLASQYGAGTKTYLDALGLNGADAAKAAQSSFTTSPGYQQGIDAGLDAINRRRAAAGMSDSGNADLDALNFAQNNQNQQYNSWLDRLSGVNNNNMSATGAIASGQAGVYGGLADLSNQYGQNQVSLLGNTTSGQTNANNLQAQGEAAGARNLLGAGLGLASMFTGGGGLGSALGGLAGGGSGLGSALGSMGITYGLPGTANSNLFGPVR